MKILTLLSILLSYLALPIYGIDNYSNKKYENVLYLSNFCKVYGLVKYQSGGLKDKSQNVENYTLLHLKKIKHTKNAADFNVLLEEYLSGFKISKNSTKIKKLEKRIDQSWTNNQLFNDNNKTVFDALIASKSKNKNSTFKLESRGKVINHLNEASFASFDEDTYTLGFFQFWNIIEFFYPNKHSFETSWDNVLIDNIPLFYKIDNRKEYIDLISKITTYLFDSHCYVKDLKGNAPKLVRHPYGFQIVDEEVVLFDVLNDSLKLISSIKRGDILTHINGVSIDTVMLNYRSKNSHSRNEVANGYFIRQLPVLLEDSVQFMFNDSINVISKKYTFDRINLDIYYNNSLNYKEINKDIGYINASDISFFEFGKAIRKLRKKKSLIFDCRGYASLAVLRYGKLLNGKSKQVSKYYYPSYKNPGYYKSYGDNFYGGPLTILLKAIGILPNSMKKITPSLRKPYKGDVVILISNSAVSFGETSIMTLQAYLEKSILIGSATAGANGNVCSAQIIGDLEVGYTGIDFRYANNKILQKTGIKPDIEVKRDRASFLNKEDAVLRFAINYLNGLSCK